LLLVVDCDGLTSIDEKQVLAAARTAASGCALGLSWA